MTVSSDENIARLVSSEWVLNGILQPVAFTLNYGETYLSVNRPIIQSYDTDVRTFIEAHPRFSIDSNEHKYRRALLNVGEVRECKAMVGDTDLRVDVEVEPRTAHIKSHAGIFTRFLGNNVKPGQTFRVENTSSEISADTILLEIRTCLMEIATLETCIF